MVREVGVPSPKKLSPDSIKIAAKKFRAETTITGAIILGRMCLKMILK